MKPKRSSRTSTWEKEFRKRFVDGFAIEDVLEFIKSEKEISVRETVSKFCDWMKFKNRVMYIKKDDFEKLIDLLLSSLNPEGDKG